MIAQFGNIKTGVSFAGSADNWRAYQAAKKYWNQMQELRKISAPWGPELWWTPWKDYTIKGYPSNTKIDLKTTRIKRDTKQWDIYFSRIFRNFRLDYFGTTNHNDRVAAVTDMPALAQRMAMMDAEGKVDIDPSVALNPNQADPIAAAQYSKSTTTKNKNMTDNFLKYAPGVGVGLAVFKLIFKG